MCSTYSVNIQLMSIKISNLDNSLDMVIFVICSLFDLETEFQKCVTYLIDLLSIQIVQHIFVGVCGIDCKGHVWLFAHMYCFVRGVCERTLSILWPARVTYKNTMVWPYDLCYSLHRWLYTNYILVIYTLLPPLVSFQPVYLLSLFFEGVRAAVSPPCSYSTPTQLLSRQESWSVPKHENIPPSSSYFFKECWSLNKNLWCHTSFYC